MIELKREMHWEENENENFKTPSHGDDLFCGCPFSYNTLVLCQDLAQNKMRSSATKLLTENRPSHTFFQSR